MTLSFNIIKYAHRCNASRVRSHMNRLPKRNTHWELFAVDIPLVASLSMMLMLTYQSENEVQYQFPKTIKIW